MTNVETNEDEGLEKKKPTLRLAGGTDFDGGGDGDGPDWRNDARWLFNLPLGSVFLAQDIRYNNTSEDRYCVLYGPYTIIGRSPRENGVFLAMETPQGQHIIAPWDTQRFMGKYRMFDLLHLGTGKEIQPQQFNEEEAPKGDDNGNSEGTVQP